MATPTLDELLPPLKHMPWMTPQRRLRAAAAARDELRRWGYELRIFPSGRQLYVVMPGRQPVPEDVQKVARRHWNALLALLGRPRECVALMQGRWRRPNSVGVTPGAEQLRIRFARRTAP